MPTTARLRPDVPFGELPPDVHPGDVWRYLDHQGGEAMSARAYCGESGRASGNLTDECWGVALPGDYGVGTLMYHTVRVTDGVVSCRPGDGSSNSILHTGPAGTWHGYIVDGEFVES